MSDPSLSGDNYVDLDLGDVESIHGWLPVPTAIYTLAIDDAVIEPTKDQKNKNLVFRIKVAEGVHAGRSIGITRAFIPNRETQTPDAYKTTAGYFKGKIEAITGKPYSRFNVRELVGMKFKGLVVLKDDGYGPQNEIATWLPVTADTTGIVIPQSAPVARPRQENGGGATQDTAAAGRFKI